MNRRNFMLVLAAGGAVIALPGCDRIPASATAPWLGPPAQLAEPRLRALSWALLAPNPHNMQPWLADIREPDTVVLRIDRERLLPATDPHSRQIVIGCGAFTELLRMAAAREGWRADVTWLPEGAYAADAVDDRPFARVAFQRAAAPAADALFDAAPLRRTTRSPYEGRLPDAAALQALKAAGERPGITLHHAVDPAQVARLRALAIEGYRIEFTRADTWGESARVVRLGADAVAAEPSGVAVTGTAAWWGRRVGVLNDKSLADPRGIAARTAVEDSTRAAEATPAWLWLASADNTRRSQLEAGVAWLRTHLAAASLGLALQPNSQVLQEFDAMRDAYRRFHREVGVTGGDERVQMFARLGHAGRPDPAPRRPLAALMQLTSKGMS